MIKPNAKFRNPWTTPAGRKVNGSEREEEKNALNGGHYVLPETPKASTLTSLGPILVRSRRNDKL